MSIFRAENLHKRFGSQVVLEDISLTFPAGGVSGIMGPNGAGKSTCFNVLTGMYRPDRGRVLFEDEDITGLAPSEITRKGISPDTTLHRLSHIPSTSVLACASHLRPTVLGHVALGLKCTIPTPVATAIFFSIFRGSLCIRLAPLLTYAATTPREELLRLNPPAGTRQNGQAPLQRHGGCLPPHQKNLDRCHPSGSIWLTLPAR